MKNTRSKIVFIHTISGLEPVFETLSRKYLPHSFEICHISDQSLIQSILKNNGLSPYIYKRLSEHAAAAEASGAAVIQYTCSSISGTAETISKFVNIPVLTIDFPVMLQAVKKYQRIGLIATNPATLKPSTDSLNKISASIGRNPQIIPLLCSGAFDALLKGDKVKHDEIVKKYLLNLMKKTDAVILAQASMARISDTLSSEEKKIPVLSSPEPAIQFLSKFINKL